MLRKYKCSVYLLSIISAAEETHKTINSPHADSRSSRISSSIAGSVCFPFSVTME